MINIVGGLLGSGFGILLVKMAYDHAKDCIDQIDHLKSQGKMRKGEWLKASGRVTEVGLNTDYPEVLKDWPVRGKFNSDEEFNHAIRLANEQVQESALTRYAYGNVLIRYEFTDHEGNKVKSRTIGLLPDHERDRSMAMKLRPGSKVTVFYPKSNSAMSILRKTSEDDFKAYYNSLLGPAIGKLAAGGIIFSLSLASMLPAII